MPDFVKGLFHIHEHGRTGVSSVSGLCCYVLVERVCRWCFCVS